MLKFLNIMMFMLSVQILAEGWMGQMLSMQDYPAEKKPFHIVLKCSTVYNLLTLLKKIKIIHNQTFRAQQRNSMCLPLCCMQRTAGLLLQTG